MEDDNNEELIGILTLIKLDSQGLFKRIKGRKKSYMDVFSVRRTREHFPEIFFNKYRDFSANILVKVSSKIIVSVDEFYTKVDEIKWYLMTTQDMPATVAENLEKMIMSLEKSFYKLNELIDESLKVL